MTKLEKKLRASLRRLGIHKRDPILVAVSGGADSIALLDALARWKQSEHLAPNLFAAHLNHLLRGEESDADETFVREFLRQRNIPSFIAQENVAAAAAQEKNNLEATARQLRYDFLLRSATQCQARIIVTAHTHNDQVETILLRLLRGTSAAGLHGIYAEFEMSPGIRLVRPMLDITRDEVLDHCARYQLRFRHDSSNESMDFTRNRIRHELLPVLQSYNPRIGQTLQRTAQQLSEDDAYLQQEASRLVQALAEETALNFKPLLTLHAAVRRRVLRQWLAQIRGDLRRIGAAHLVALDEVMMSGEGGSVIELPGGWQVQRQQHWLKLQPVPTKSRTVA